MLDVKVDLIKNRLYITLGRIQKNKVKNALSVVEKATLKLEPGFTCVTRIIDARDIDANDIAEIKKIQTMLAGCGMTKAVRIGAENGKQLLDMVGKDVTYLSTEASSLAEAEELLDNWVEQNTRLEMGGSA